MDLKDLSVFTENLSAELRLFGEDVVFDKIRILEEKGWYYGNVVTPFFTRLSKERRYRDAQALHDKAVAAGLTPWSIEQEQMRQANLAQKRPSILLATLPKTGSAYLEMALGNMLRMPAIQATLARFPNDYLLPEIVRRLAEGGIISQSHLDARTENLDLLHEAGLRQIHVHVRDPRQATVSWAVWMAGEITGVNSHKRYLSDPFQPVDINGESEAWRMEWYAGNHYPACIRWIQQWVQAAERDRRFTISITDHEELKADRVGTLRKILATFGLDPDLATQDTTLAPKAGVAHYRQGSNDEWRMKIPAHVQEWMNAMLPVGLKQRFGWPDS